MRWLAGEGPWEDFAAMVARTSTYYFVFFASRSCVHGYFFIPMIRPDEQNPRKNGRTWLWTRIGKSDKRAELLYERTE